MRVNSTNQFQKKKKKSRRISNDGLSQLSSHTRRRETLKQQKVPKCSNRKLLFLYNGETTHMPRELARKQNPSSPPSIYISRNLSTLVFPSQAPALKETSPARNRPTHPLRNPHHPAGPRFPHRLQKNSLTHHPFLSDAAAPHQQNSHRKS